MSERIVKEIERHLNQKGEQLSTLIVAVIEVYGKENFQKWVDWKTAPGEQNVDANPQNQETVR